MTELARGVRARTTLTQNLLRCQRSDAARGLSQGRENPLTCELGRAGVLLVLLSNFAKPRGVSEGPRREKNQKSLRTLPLFEILGMAFNHACHWFGRNAQFPQENGDFGGLNLIFSPASVRYGPVRCPSYPRRLHGGKFRLKGNGQHIKFRTKFRATEKWTA